MAMTMARQESVHNQRDFPPGRPCSILRKNLKIQCDNRHLKQYLERRQPSSTRRRLQQSLF